MQNWPQMQDASDSKYHDLEWLFRQNVTLDTQGKVHQSQPRWHHTSPEGFKGISVVEFGLKGKKQNKKPVS